MAGEGDSLFYHFMSTRSLSLYQGISLNSHVGSPDWMQCFIYLFILCLEMGMGFSGEKMDGGEDMDVYDLNTLYAAMKFSTNK